MVCACRLTYTSSHDATDGRGDLEQVGNCLRVKQLVLGVSDLLTVLMVYVGGIGGGETQITYGDFTLGDDYRSVLSTDSNSSNARS